MSVTFPPDRPSDRHEHGDDDDPRDDPRPVSRGWTVLWILLIGTFLLVSLAWPVRADRLSATASRTDTFGAPPG